MRPEKTTDSSRNERSLSTSVIVGLLLVPLSALAAIALVNPRQSAEKAEVPAIVAADPTPVPSIAEDGQMTTEDLAVACGAAGLDLVAAEQAGSISDIQQAGLDALREICASQGTALPTKPAPEPIVETVIVGGGSASSALAASTAQGRHDDEESKDDVEDDHQEDEDHEEEDHQEDEDHEEEDHGEVED